MSSKKDVKPVVFPVYPIEKYSVDVLVGNWFEQRISSFVDPHAIVPILCGKTDCHKTAETEYGKNFRKVTPEERVVVVEDVRDVQFNAEKYKHAVKEVHIDTLAELQENDNCTTYELSFRYRGKERPENTIRAKKRVKVEDPFLQNMENKKKVERRRALLCEKKRFLRMPTNLTTYREHFKGYSPRLPTNELCK